MSVSILRCKRGILNTPLACRHSHLALAAQRYLSLLFLSIFLVFSEKTNQNVDSIKQTLTSRQQLSLFLFVIMYQFTNIVHTCQDNYLQLNLYEYNAQNIMIHLSRYSAACSCQQEYLKHVFNTVLFCSMLRSQ